MDWKLLIQNLISSGLTETEIAKDVGCSQPSVNQLKTGVVKEPKHRIGSALIELHENLNNDSLNANENEIMD